MRGPLNVARSPQGQPVIVQAGASQAGLALAAAHAEVVFATQSQIDPAHAFRADLRGHVAAAGRNPDSLKVMPGLNPVIGRTRAEAQEFYDDLQSRLSPELGLTALAPILPEVDLSGCDPDKPIPASLLPETTNASLTDLKRLKRQTEEGMTLRQIYTQFAGARGQTTVIGTGEDIADHIIRWVDAGACDGFLIQPPVLPLGLRAFTEQVVPILQERGYLRTAYEGSTLRENLGLPKPANRYTAAGIAYTAPSI